MRLFLISVIAAIACSSCASGITVTHLRPGASSVEGNPWNLPMTQFNITITRHITGCGEKIKGKVEVLPSAAVVFDQEQQYVLRSKGWWSTSDITSNLAQNGVSTGLNAQSADATATVITNAIGLIGQVAIGAAAAKAPMGAAPAPTELCKVKVATAVAELYPPEGSKIAPLKKQVDKDIADLAAATARVALLTAQVKVDKSLKKELVESLGDQAAKQKKLEDDQAKFTRDMNLTTDITVVHWPHVASEFRKDPPYVLSDEVWEDWTESGADSKAAQDEFGVYLALYQLVSDGSWTAPAQPAAANVKVGVPVRLAKTGRLLVCRRKACPPTLAEGPSQDKDQLANDFDVLQLGQMYTIPAAGGWFRSESAAISLDAATGRPTSVQVAEKVAGAAALTGAGKDAATQLAGLPAQIRAAQLAKTQAQTNQITAESTLAATAANAGLQAEASMLGAQTALINAQNALATAKANAGLSLETSAATAQTALLNAQAALATAQANAHVVDQTSVVAAQTTLTNAQTAQINAAAALARAQATMP